MYEQGRDTGFAEGSSMATAAPARISVLAERRNMRLGESMEVPIASALLNAK